MGLYWLHTIFLIAILLLPQVTLFDVKAYSDHPNLFVSAENSLFENHFSGAMVVEVIVTEDNKQLDQALGEPNVTVAGRQLHLAQGSDGNWYGFFANTAMAKQADQVASSLSGNGDSLDFGVFCSGSTPKSVLGVDFSQTDGVAIPDSAGLVGKTQGLASFNSCSGNPSLPITIQNNVLRHTMSLNTNQNVPPGQIGINPNAWPVIQLFTFSNNVHVEYNGAGGTQSVDLDYSDIHNITVQVDRTGYPRGSDVFVKINDMQLNEDPTSVDSWTFNVVSPPATFYQAFAEDGKSAGGTGLVNLFPYLPSLGFNKNGEVEMNLGNIINLKTNSIQTNPSVISSGITYDRLVTFVETGPNTGIFQSSFNNISTVGISQSAPRFQSGSVQYNQQGVSIVSGTATASLNIGEGHGQFDPGQKETITLTDNNQNLNPGTVDQLDVFRSSAVIPTLKIGNPLTLTSASDVKFYPDSSNFNNAIPTTSSVPDKNSARLLIDTRSIATTNFEKITMNLGITAQALKDLFIDVNQQNSAGTNWINYDLRSFQQQLGIVSLSDTSITLHFGGLPGTSVQILPAGGISSGNGLVQISNTAISSIESISPSLPVFLEINFDTSADPAKAGRISNEMDTQPIVFDLFSFGNKNGQSTNNAVYRAELQETSSNSGIFKGTIEYAVINQLNQFDPNLIKSLRTFGSQIKFLVNNQLIDDKGINFSIISSQAGQSTVVTSKNNLLTHTGIVTLDSQSYRIGQPVTISLYDPDLVGDAGTIQSFVTVNDPTSSADNTVGDSGGNILLEVWIKGFRFHSCMINGITYGGLAATGFTLTETGPGTGLFKGIFKMPSKICSEDGTQLISPVGGSVQVWYHDFRDELGRSIIVGSTVPSLAKTYTTIPTEKAPSVNIDQSMEISDNSGRPLLEKPKVGQTINFQNLISNKNEQNSQRISYIVQIKNNENKVVFLKWINDILNPSSNVKEKIQWTPIMSGSYSIEIYIWDSMETLVPLEDKKQFSLQVSG